MQEPVEVDPSPGTSLGTLTREHVVALEERAGFHTEALISVKLSPQQLGSMKIFKSMCHFHPEAQNSTYYSPLPPPFPAK